MTDSPEPISRDFRTGIAVTTLALEYAGYAFLTWYGDPENAMHVSAQTGLWWGAHLILAGGFIAIVAPRVFENLTGKP